MPPNLNPEFTAVANIGTVTINTANAARDGSGAVGTVLTAGANGTRITRIRIKATVTVTAGMIRFFLYTGAAYFLYREVAVPADTASATDPSYEIAIELLGDRALVLPTGWSLRASTEKAEAFNIIAEGGDY